MIFQVTVTGSAPTQKGRMLDETEQKTMAAAVNLAVQEQLRSGGLTFSDKPYNEYHPMLEGYVYQKNDGSFYAVMTRNEDVRVRDRDGHASIDFNAWNRLTVTAGKPAVANREDDEKEIEDRLVGAVLVSKYENHVQPVGDYIWSGIIRFPIGGNAFTPSKPDMLYVRVGRLAETSALAGPVSTAD